MNMDDFVSGLSGRGIDPKNFHSALEKYLVDKKILKHKGVESLGVYGHLSIYKQYDDGQRDLLWSDHNLIVNSGFQILSLIWSGEPGSPTELTDVRPFYIAVGNPTAPSTPAASQVTLDNATLKRSFDSITFIGTPNINGVQFEMIIPKSVGNGVTYSEAGLFPFDFNGSAATPPTGGMIARQTYTGIPKNSTFQLAYQWRFTFAQT